MKKRVFTGNDISKEAERENFKIHCKFTKSFSESARRLEEEGKPAFNFRVFGRITGNL